MKKLPSMGCLVASDKCSKCGKIVTTLPVCDLAKPGEVYFIGEPKYIGELSFEKIDREIEMNVDTPLDKNILNARFNKLLTEVQDSTPRVPCHEYRAWSCYCPKCGLQELGIVEGEFMDNETCITCERCGETYVGRR